MAYDAYLYFLLVAEVLVVVHLARDEGIAPAADGIVQQEVAGTATDGHFRYGSLQQLVAVGAGHAKGLLDLLHEAAGIEWLRHEACHSAAADDVAYGLLLKEGYVCQSQLLGYLPVDPAAGIVHVGVQRHDADIVPDGLTHSTLHIVQVGHLLQPTEE